MSIDDVQPSVLRGWKKVFLRASGFGSGFAITMALIAGTWVWYESRPSKPKPWDAKAIVATFDYPDTEAGEPEVPGGVRPYTLVLYYTLENLTDSDYTMPPGEQLEVNGKLKREKSLTGGSELVTLDKERVFIPAKHRRRFAVHVHYPVKEDFGPDPDTTEDRRRRWKRIADYMNKEFSNLDGFVLFDTANRYQINVPNGWDNIDPK